jgi:hypothetical protein
MYTRNSSTDPKPLEPRARPNGAQSPLSSPSGGEKSVIGNDLKIIGQGLKIISRGMLQVDGEIEGDVQAAEVIVGERGQVSGMVAGRQVVVRGKISGVVCGQTVALQASSQVKAEAVVRRARRTSLRLSREEAERPHHRRLSGRDLRM